MSHSNLVKFFSKERIRSKKGLSEISQFSVVLYVLFLLLLVPLLDLVNLFVGAAVQYLATNDIAAKVATQQNYSSSLNTLFNEATSFQTNGLAQYINLTPNGGYAGCGNDLYVVSTNSSTGAVQTSGANLALNQTIDTTANMYEIKVKSNYTVPPLVSLAALPLLGEIPGLSQPVSFTFSANRPVEQPAGLQATQSNSNTQNSGTGAGSGKSSSSTVTPFKRLATAPPQTPAPPNGTSWNNSNIYNLIKQSGQTVLSNSVMIVPVNLGPANTTGGWVKSGLSVSNGQYLWLDATGSSGWNLYASYTPSTIPSWASVNYQGTTQSGTVSVDINGCQTGWSNEALINLGPNLSSCYCSVVGGYSPGSLLCFTGNSGPPIYPYGFQVPPYSYYTGNQMIGSGC